MPSCPGGLSRRVALLCLYFIVASSLVYQTDGSDAVDGFSGLRGKEGVPPKYEAKREMFGEKPTDKTQEEIRNRLSANQLGPVGDALGDRDEIHIQRGDEVHGFQGLQTQVESLLSTLPPSVSTPVEAVHTLQVSAKLMSISSGILKQERIKADEAADEYKKNTWWITRQFTAEDKLPPKLAAPMLIFFKGLHALGRLQSVRFNQNDYDKSAEELDIKAFSSSIGSLHDSMEEFLMHIPDEYAGGSVVYNVRYRINDLFDQLDVMSSKLAAAKKRLAAANEEEKDPCAEDAEGQSINGEVKEILEANKALETEEDVDIWNAHLTVGDIGDDMAASNEYARRMVRKNRTSGKEEAKRFAGYVAITGLAGAAHFTKDMYSLAWPYQRDFKTVPGPQFGRMLSSGNELSGTPGRAMDLKDRSINLLEDSQGLTDKADTFIAEANQLGGEIEVDVQTLNTLGEDQVRLAQEQKAIYDEMDVLQQQMRAQAPYPPTRDQINRMNQLQAQGQQNTAEMQRNHADMEQTAEDMMKKRERVEELRADAEVMYEEGMVSYEEAKGIRDDALQLLKDAELHVNEFIEAAKVTFVDTPLAVAENAVTFVVSFLPDLIVTGLEMAIGILTGPFFVLTAAHLLYRIIKFAMRPPKFRHSDICNPKIQLQCCYDEVMSWEKITEGMTPVPKFDISWLYKHEPQGDCIQTQAWLRANYELVRSELMEPLDLGKNKAFKAFDKSVVRSVCARVQPKMVCGYRECQMCKQLATIGMKDFSKQDFCESFLTYGSGGSFVTAAKDSASALQPTPDGERLRTNTARRKRFDDYYNYHLCTAIRSHFNKYHSSKRLRKGEIFPSPLCAESGFCLNSEFWVAERRPECGLCRQMVLFKGIGGKMKSVCKKVSSNFVEVSKNCDEVYKKLKTEPAEHRERVQIEHIFTKDEDYAPNTCPVSTYLKEVPGYGNKACDEYCRAQSDLAPLILPGDGSAHKKYELVRRNMDLWGLEQTSSKGVIDRISRGWRKFMSKSTIEDRFSTAVEYLESEQIRWSRKKTKWDAEAEELNTSRILNYKLPIGGVTGFASASVSEICGANTEEIEAAKKSLLKFDTFLLDQNSHSTMDDYQRELKGMHSYFVEFRLLIHSIKNRYEKYRAERLPKIRLPEQRGLSGVSGTAIENQIRSWQTTLKCETRIITMYRTLSKRTSELVAKAKEETSKFDNAAENFIDANVDTKGLLKMIDKTRKAFQESKQSIIDMAKKKKVVDLINGVDPYSKCFIRALNAVDTVEHLRDWKIAKDDLKKVEDWDGSKGKSQLAQVLLKNVAGMLERTATRMNMFENESNLKVFELRDLTAFSMEQYRIGFRSTAKFETALAKLTRQVDKSIETWKKLDDYLINLYTTVQEELKTQLQGLYEDPGSIDPEDTLKLIQAEKAKRDAEAAEKKEMLAAAAPNEASAPADGA